MLSSTPAPMSASINRCTPTVPSAATTVRMAPAAACTTTIRAPPSMRASAVAQKIAIASVSGPPPSAALVSSPTTNPRITPYSSRSAIKPRSGKDALNADTAAIGAKKGSSCPAMCTAQSQAIVAASTVWLSVHRCSLSRRTPRRIKRRARSIKSISPREALTLFLCVRRSRACSCCTRRCSGSWNGRLHYRRASDAGGDPRAQQDGLQDRGLAQLRACTPVGLQREAEDDIGDPLEDEIDSKHDPEHEQRAHRPASDDNDPDDDADDARSDDPAPSARRTRAHTARDAKQTRHN